MRCSLPPGTQNTSIPETACRQDLSSTVCAYRAHVLASLDGAVRCSQATNYSERSGPALLTDAAHPSKNEYVLWLKLDAATGLKGYSSQRAAGISFPEAISEERAITRTFLEAIADL